MTTSIGDYEEFAVKSFEVAGTDEIQRDDLKLLIKARFGMDNKTVEKHFRNLLEFKIIQPAGASTFRLGERLRPREISI